MKGKIQKWLKIMILGLVVLALSVPQAEASEGGGSFNPGDMINHHILDSHVYEIAEGFVIPLPVILYSSDRGLEMFSSANLFDENHNAVEYNGYTYDHGHILTTDASRKIIDFSITKNVAFLFLNAVVMLIIFLMVANRYKKYPKEAPKGIQSLFEPIIVFIKDDIVKANIGHGYEKYLPYMLTLFFFVWFGNLLGLMPGAANLTGNIAVTMVLAVGTFLLTNFSGNKNYWGHIFNPPGVPVALKPIIVPVEIIGIFTKPISLMIRLFVAITAGHVVILSLLSLIFIFESWFVGFGSAIIVTFINIIEILVATIQAYVFTMFSSLYIGMATEDHH